MSTLALLGLWVVVLVAVGIAAFLRWGRNRDEHPTSDDEAPRTVADLVDRRARGLDDGRRRGDDSPRGGEDAGEQTGPVHAASTAEDAGAAAEAAGPEAAGSTGTSEDVTPAGPGSGADGADPVVADRDSDRAEADADPDSDHAAAERSTGRAVVGDPDGSRRAPGAGAVESEPPAQEPATDPRWSAIGPTISSAPDITEVGDTADPDEEDTDEIGAVAPSAPPLGPDVSTGPVGPPWSRGFKDGKPVGPAGHRPAPPRPRPVRSPVRRDPGISDTGDDRVGPSSSAPDIRPVPGIGLARGIGAVPRTGAGGTGSPARREPGSLLRPAPTPPSTPDGDPAPTDAREGRPALTTAREPTPPAETAEGPELAGSGVPGTPESAARVAGTVDTGSPDEESTATGAVDGTTEIGETTHAGAAPEHASGADTAASTEIAESAETAESTETTETTETAGTREGTDAGGASAVPGLPAASVRPAAPPRADPRSPVDPDLVKRVTAVPADRSGSRSAATPDTEREYREARDRIAATHGWIGRVPEQAGSPEPEDATPPRAWGTIGLAATGGVARDQDPPEPPPRPAPRLLRSARPSGDAADTPPVARAVPAAPATETDPGTSTGTGEVPVPPMEAPRDMTAPMTPAVEPLDTETPGAPVDGAPGHTAAPDATAPAVGGDGVGGGAGVRDEGDVTLRLGRSGTEPAPVVPGTPPQDVEVRVLGPGEAPLGGAAVTVRDRASRTIGSAVTGDDGLARVAVPGAGRFVVVAGTAGFRPGVTACAVADSTAQTVLVLRRSAAVHGTIRTASGAAAVDTAVALEQDGDPVADTRTGRDGTYRIDDLDAGRYRLVVDLDGTQVPGTVDLTAGAEVAHDVTGGPRP
ncbi:carboxypeptidase regulatory-like domain-containing protein [Pseudonocardia nematodicida]|uniref:Carboxypeptidase regulatory-like domain-containing protein n=1 Tax=Pseudonocardia nematodicida TaxID=1206997 RepID=A0ABV1KKX4_9PSEU